MNDQVKNQLENNPPIDPLTAYLTGQLRAGSMGSLMQQEAENAIAELERANRAINRLFGEMNE